MFFLERGDRARYIKKLFRGFSLYIKRAPGITIHNDQKTYLKLAAVSKELGPPPKGRKLYRGSMEETQ